MKLDAINADLLGRWAVCQKGMLGRVEKFKRTCDGRIVAHGWTANGAHWQSVAPTYLNEVHSRLLDEKL